MISNVFTLLSKLEIDEGDVTLTSSIRSNDAVKMPMPSKILQLGPKKKKNNSSSLVIVKGMMLTVMVMVIILIKED